MQIGSISIPGPLVLAPMAGVSDLAFRAICREMGCDYTITEMISSKALCYQDKKTLPLMELGEGESPAAVQLFGCDPVCMQEAAAIAVARTHAPILDINMGCPVPKVANNGSGSGLMKTPDLAAEIVAAVCRGGGVPVTVKIRKGWDKGSINCVEFARLMESAGAAAIAVHGRTRAQMYAGQADWDCIRQVKEAVSIPVIANGDVFSPQAALRIQKWTGCDGIMIGRAAFGNPWIFAQCACALRGEEIPSLPPLARRCETAVRQFTLAAQNKGEKIACLEARRHYAWYLKGVPYASYYKQQIGKIDTLQDIHRLTAAIQRDLRDAVDGEEQR